MWIVETRDVFDDWYASLDDVDRENVLASLLEQLKRGKRNG